MSELDGIMTYDRFNIRKIAISVGSIDVVYSLGVM